MNNNNQETTSLLALMEDGREFESLLKVQSLKLNLRDEILEAIGEIQRIRERQCIVYVANVVNNSIKDNPSIDYSDDLPFSELINTIPDGVSEIDIIIVTPGGSGTQVAKFVDKLRGKFEKVNFILPDIAMSAGTIFCMSGDEIIMTNNSYIGPIDPQVPNKEGMYVPAQSLLALIREIQIRGEKNIKQGLSPDWTDLQILKGIDPKEIGNAVSASNFSVELVENYLYNYKFRLWTHHSNQTEVTEDEKRSKANEIANLLCDHSLWKSHGKGITREIAWTSCKLKITKSEDIPELDRAIKRFWALFYWIFENTKIFKTFASDYYFLNRNSK